LVAIFTSPFGLLFPLLFKDFFELFYDLRLESLIADKFDCAIAVPKVDNHTTVEFAGGGLDYPCQNFIVGFFYCYWYFV